MLPRQPLRIEVVVGYTFDILSFSTCYEYFLTVVMVTCYHGNHTKGNICAKFDAHTQKPYPQTLSAGCAVSFRLNLNEKKEEKKKKKMKNSAHHSPIHL